MAEVIFARENRVPIERVCAPYNLSMESASFTVRGLRRVLAHDETSATMLAQQALEQANGNAGRNTYLWQSREWTLSEAARMEAMPRRAGGPFGDGRSALWGLPVSVKDCLDLAGAPTSCGVRFYRDRNGNAKRDSWLVERLRSAGAVITGKTHLHPLAYGITGENPEFGDCVQPGDSGALTGGSSSGAAASVLEGSAVAAIGTDTGGSIRAPAALCGLAGFRATLGRGDWHGCAHLAESFDTMGWLFRDLEDTPLLASFFAGAKPDSDAVPTRVGIVHQGFLHDCEPEIVKAMQAVVRELDALGLDAKTIEAGWWNEAFEVYAPIQAWEAAQIHAGHFVEFPAPLPERLRWGAAIKSDEIAALRRRHDEFRARMDDLLRAHELLLMPATPVTRLATGADHSRTRPKILRYTTPFSLAGVPVVTIPCRHGGMQLAAARECDEPLAAIAARLGAHRKTAQSKA